MTIVRAVIIYLPVPNNSANIFPTPVSKQVCFAGQPYLGHFVNTAVKCRYSLSMLISQ